MKSLRASLALWCWFAASLLFSTAALGRQPVDPLSVPLLVLSKRVIAQPCPTNLPVNTVVVTQVVDVPTLLTNITSTTTPLTNVACTNLTTTNLTPTNEVIITVIPTNTVTVSVTLSNLPVTNVTFTPVTFTNLVPTNALITQIEPYLVCVTNVTVSNRVDSEIISTNILWTNWVTTNIATETVLLVPTNMLVMVQTNIVFVDRGVTNVYTFEVPEYVQTNVLVTNVTFTPYTYEEVVSSNLTVTNIVTEPVILTNVVCDSGFITNVFTTNFFLTEVVFTNFATTNISFEPFFVTNTVVTPSFITNTVTTNYFITNLFSTNFCLTNITSMIGFLTNVISTNLVQTNFVTTNVTPAGVLFASATWSVAEDATNAIITIVRIGDTNASVSVTVSTSDDSATASSDYTTTSTTISFAQGVLSQQVSVPILDDQIFEGDETVRLSLSNPVNAVLIAPCEAVLTIIDNDRNADLVLSKESSLSVLRLGETNEWILTLRNNGPATATNIVVEDRLPGGFSALFSRPASGTTWSDDLSEWRIPSLASGATSSVVLGFRWISAGTVTNCARIVSSQPTDTVTNNNQACATATWRKSTNDIAVTKEALVGQTNVGGVIGFRIVIRNNGPDDARFVNVFDTVPAGAVLVGSILPPGTITSPGTPGAFTLPSLTNGQSAELIVRLRGDTNAFLTNCVSANPSISDEDPNTANNNACAGALWGGSADLEVFWEADSQNPPVISQRTDGNWRVVLTNKGPDSVTNVSVRVSIPAHFAINFSGPGGRPDAVNSEFDRTTRVWRLTSTLASGNSAILRLGLMPTNAGPAEFIAEVMSSPLADPDSTPGNGVQSEDDFSRYSFNVETNFAISGTIWFCDAWTSDNFRPSVEVRAMQGTNVVSSVVAVSGNGDQRPFSVTNLTAGTYTLSASAPGYVFTNNGPFTVGPNIANPANAIVEAVMPAFLPTFTACQGQPLPEGIMVRISGATNFVVPVGTNGQAVITNLVMGAQYVLTPFHPWLSFTPASSTNTPRNGRFDCRVSPAFQACPTLTISGRLTGCATNGPGIALVPITLSGPTNVIGTNITDGSGRFVFTNLYPGPYQLAAATNLVIVPPVSVVLGTNSLVTNLVSSAATFVAGRVTENTNTGPAVTNLMVILTGTNNLVRTNFTDTNGFFIFTNLTAGRYVVRPFTNSPAYQFVPTNAALFVGSATNCTNYKHFIANVKRAELVSMEVMQVVQGWTNPVSLVAGKPTFVRAHLQPAGTNITPVLIEGAQLVVKKAGLTLARINPNPGRLLARTNAALHRTNLNSSLNFPVDLWLTRLRGVIFEFQWTNGILIRREPAGGGDPASNAVVSVDFQATPILPVRWLAVEYTNHFRFDIPLTTNFLTLVITNRPTMADIPVYQREVLSMYPVSRMTNRQASYRWLVDAPSHADMTNRLIPWDKSVALWRQLRALRAADASPNDQFIGIVPGGAGRPFFRNAGGNGVATFQEVGLNDNRRHETGHEMGHALGRPHPIKAGTVAVGGQLAGVCGETESNPPADFFPMHPINVGGAMTDRPTLGPVDVRAPEGWILGWYEDRRTLVNPFRTFELMSYCNGTPPWKWPSQFTYERLFTALRGAYGIPLLPFNLAKSSAPVPSILVRGSVNLLSGAAELSPLYIFPEAGQPGLPEAGAYRLRMVGPGGAALIEIPFDAPAPPFEAADGEPPIDLGLGFFNFRVPLDPTAVAVQVVRDGQILAERALSPSAPSVVFTAPAAGTEIGDEPVTLAWNVTDADSDALVSLLQWSADGGGNWETLSIDLPMNEFEVVSTSLRGSTNAFFRVLVTDGLRTSVAQTGPFTVQDHIPTLSITAPSPGMQFAYGDQVEFIGIAHDHDDGDLDDDSLIWTSDRDGEIGRGSRFSKPAEDLATGRHVIQLVATDHTGNSVTNTVDISIGTKRSPLMKVSREAGMLRITWSRLDEGFTVESASVLDSSEWSAVEVETSETEDEFIVEVPDAVETRFYRLNRKQTE